MAELADARDLKSREAFPRTGSIPVSSTTKRAFLLGSALFNLQRRMDMLNVLGTIATHITNFGVKLIYALLVLIIGLKASKWLSKKLYSAKSPDAVDEGVQKFAAKAVKISLYIIVIISAAGILGIPYASFVAVLGSAGVAVGLAMQGSLSNLAAGILILVTKPFRVGDMIEAGDIMGKVSEIGFFSTHIVTLDNRVVSFPNSALSGKCITNYSAKPTRCVNLVFTAGYGSDVEKVKEILTKTAESCPRMVAEPAPYARLSKLGDSALEFILFAWCKSEEYRNACFDLTESVKEAFDKESIEIPYQKLDINILK